MRHPDFVLKCRKSATLRDLKYVKTVSKLAFLVENDIVTSLMMLRIWHLAKCTVLTFIFNTCGPRKSGFTQLCIITGWLTFSLKKAAHSLRSFAFSVHLLRSFAHYTELSAAYIRRPSSSLGEEVKITVALALASARCD